MADAIKQVKTVIPTNASPSEDDARRRQQEDRRRHEDEVEQRVKERTAALEETIRELNTFAYTVAHDLRAPLRAMQSFSQILLDEHAAALNEEGQDLAQRIRDAARRMDSLIQDLLAYSRLSREDIALTEVDVAPVIDDALRNLSNEIKGSDATVEVVPPLPHVRAHALLLTQAITNLVSNAIKFTAPGTRPAVVIRAERRGPDVRLWVDDNGIGIAPEHHARLFRVFERLHPPSRYGGTGVGLAIVRRALERMNGTCGVESAEGQGSRFWIQLAAADGPTDAAAALRARQRGRQP